jgi:hypothetical protein
VNVFELVPEITYPAQYKVKITSLPDGTPRGTHLCQFRTRATFEFTHHRDETDIPWRNEKVKVSWHDHIREDQKLIGCVLAS